MRPLFVVPVLAALVSPAFAWDRPEAIAGTYRLTASDAGGAPCDVELLAPIAYEFEGVWYVARPLHSEDNRVACLRLGIDDVVAWSGVTDQAIWLLAEGEAGSMEFAPGEEGWRLTRSGHATPPDLVLARADAGD